MVLANPNPEGPVDEGGSKPGGGFPELDSSVPICPFCSRVLGLGFLFFPGIFPVFCPFPSARSAYSEDLQGTFPKRPGTQSGKEPLPPPWFGKPLFTFFQDPVQVQHTLISVSAAAPKDEGVSEGFLKAFRRGQPRTLQNPFKTPSRTLQEGVEIDDALGFPGL